MKKMLHSCFVYVLCSCEMPSKMRAMAHTQPQDWTRVSLKYFNAFVNIVVWEVDVDIKQLVKKANFIDIHCVIGLCSVERIGV